MDTLDKMNFRALDSFFNATAIIDDYDSIIWTEKYNEVGDFEIRGPANTQLLALINESTYLFNTLTSNLMVIEQPEIEFDIVNGDVLTIKGRSISSILDRRIMLVSNTITYSDVNADRRISKIICDLVTEAFGSTIPNRQWSGLEVVNATTANVTAAESTKLAVGVGLQFTLGDNLLKIVTDLCTAHNLGFKCVFVPSTKKVQFIVYEGVNRSVQGQGMIMFSDLYDNLITAKESISVANVKNAALIVGRASDPVTGVPRLPQFLVNEAFTGLNRRETYITVDQDDVAYAPNGTECTMASADYVLAIEKAGTMALNQSIYKVDAAYDGGIVEGLGTEYTVDFNLGDIVAFRLPHHPLTNAAQITSMIFADDAQTGKTLAPSFMYIEPTPTVTTLTRYPLFPPAPEPTVLAPTTGANKTITLTTFGHDYGVPAGQKYVRDVRNVTGKDSWTHHNTGYEAAVSSYVLGQSKARDHLAVMTNTWIPNLVDGDKIAIGCSKGHHRSVSIAVGTSPAGVSLKYVLEARGFTVNVVNRDMKILY